MVLQKGGRGGGTPLPINLVRHLLTLRKVPVPIGECVPHLKRAFNLQLPTALRKEEELELVSKHGESKDCCIGNPQLRVEMLISPTTYTTPPPCY